MNNLELSKGFHNLECSKNYSFGRPSYPKESIELIKQLGINNESVILDLASGTGKFTQVLAKEFDNIIAVEPSLEFRNECEMILKDLKINQNRSTLNYQIYDGLSTSMPFIESNSIDCVTTAHSFHWFSNLESIKEISRILKPNGLFLILYNKPDPEKNDYQLLKSILQLHKNSKYNNNNNNNNNNDDGRKSPTSILIENWRNVFKELEQLSEKEKSNLLNSNLIDHPSIEYVESTNGDRVISNSLSQSYMSLLPIEKKQIFINDLKENLNNNIITNNNKSFNVIYKVDISYTRKNNNDQLS